VLSYTGDQQISLSKPILCAIGLMGIIADFAVKPFSSEHLCKHLQWLKLFSTLIGLAFTF